MFPVPRRAVRFSRNLLPVPLFVALACGAIYGLAAPASAALGQWSLPNPTSPPTNFIEIHMALLPGDGPTYHSRILMYEGPEPNKGAELGWNEGTVGCASPPYALQVLGIGTWNPGANIFCNGHATLPSGELISAGGDEVVSIWGIPDSRTFQTGTSANPGSWTGRPVMQQARFYPSVTTLSDGRAIVTGGLRDQQAWYFGGRVDGSPPAAGVGDLLHRYERGTGGGWDPLVTPQVTNPGERPTPREGHTTVYLSDLNANVYFGGRDGAGNPISEQGSAWLLRRDDVAILDADYTYRWDKLSPAAGFPIPTARSEHAAVAVSATEMIVFGGTQISGQEFWRLYKDGFGAWRWQDVTFTPGTGPPARFGHAAVYQASEHRMIVFGGSNNLGVTPTDGRIFAFTFPPNDFTQGTWSEIPVAAGPAPGPRRDHIMVLDEDDTVQEPGGPFLLVYGGHLGSGTAESTLWRLSLGSSPPAVWSQVTTNGPSPGPRANHAAFYDNGFQGYRRLFIFGGEPAPSDTVDKFAYIIDPFPIAGTPEWVRGAEAPYRLSGHTAKGDPGGYFHARLPEIYNLTTNAWTTQSNSGWVPSAAVVAEYPVQFLVPGSALPGGGGRLIRVGPDPSARYLDIPATGLASGWQTVPNGSNGSFHPHTGVMYEPGKVLVVGDDVNNTETAKTFDATAMGSATWVPRPGVARSSFHNLVILPNGQVLALGGLKANQTAQPCPQLWTPSTGLWTNANPCTLDSEPVVRNYHSASLLLPDARVVSGGGNNTGTETQLRVFCPPYLYDAGGGPATRPQITSAPPSITYGEAFVIGKQIGDVISSACLIRPAATTHAFDQNQRFVPLAFEILPDGTGLRALAPQSGSHAPPGDYLLFIVNQSGVPAVAKWVRLGQCPTIPCDAGSPPQTTGLTPDIVGPNEVWLVWSAPGDDTSPLSGAFDLRFSTTGLASENDYAAATPASDEPAVQTAGTPVSCTVYNLSACTQYHFALKTRDGTGPSYKNWSLRSNTVTETTTCGGGGGFSARRVDGGAGGASAASNESASDYGGPDGASAGSSAGTRGAAVAGATALAPGAGSLVAETWRTPAGGWQVTLRLVSEPEGLDPAQAGAIVSQVRGGGGAWRTLGRYQPSPGQSPLGLCALREQGRVVFPAGYELDRVVSGMRAGLQDLALSLANHSRLGSLGDLFVAGGGGVKMELGDEISLDYSPSSEVLPEAAGWYLLVRPTGSTGSSATPVRRTLATTIPTRFALHQNQPNPFRRATTLAFDLPVASPVTLEVFDLLGRRVATLARSEFPAGAHAVEWDLRGERGETAPPGVYVYRLQAREFKAHRKMSVLP